MQYLLEMIPKEWVPTIIASLVGLAGVIIASMWKSRDTERGRRDERDKDARDKEAAEDKAEQEAEAAHAHDITARFKALLDGYESRIRDLTAEITALRSDVRDLGQRYESHQRVCQRCPHFQELIRDAKPT